MSRKAKELSIVTMFMMFIMMMMAVVEVIILFKIPNFLSGFGAGDDILDLSRVESIDKGSIVGLETTINR